MRHLEPLDSVVAAACAGAGTAAALLAPVKSWALELFGVPLPVLVAGAAGALAARTLLERASVWRALAGVALWGLIGGLAGDLAKGLVDGLAHVELPAATSIGMALATAFVAQLGAPYAPEIVAAAALALKRRFDAMGGGNGRT